MGGGCNRCRGTGFAGRIGIFELLIPTNELLEAIGRGAILFKNYERSRITQHSALMD